MAQGIKAGHGQLRRSFGFHPDESRHHFLVWIPRGSDQLIEISECFNWREDDPPEADRLVDDEEVQLRAVLGRLKWDAVADDVRVTFNTRLGKMGRRAGSWKVGANFVRREFGKELVLLIWAIEEADPALIPNALSNWQGLVPEERWWLYTQAAAATGHALRDRGKGWRKAIRYALTENPVASKPDDRPVVPQFFRKAVERSSQGALFDLEPGEKSTR